MNNCATLEELTGWDLEKPNAPGNRTQTLVQGKNPAHFLPLGALHSLDDKAITTQPENRQ